MSWGRCAFEDVYDHTHDDTVAQEMDDSKPSRSMCSNCFKETVKDMGIIFKLHGQFVFLEDDDINDDDALYKMLNRKKCLTILVENQVPFMEQPDTVLKTEEIDDKVEEWKNRLETEPETEIVAGSDSETEYFSQKETEPEGEALIDEARRIVAAERAEDIGAAYDDADEPEAVRVPEVNDFIKCTTSRSRSFRKPGRITYISPQKKIKDLTDEGVEFRDTIKDGKKFVFCDDLKQEFLDKGV